MSSCMTCKLTECNLGDHIVDEMGEGGMWNLEVHHCVNKSLSLVPLLSQMPDLHILSL